jgi:flagellar export protein FliJ
MPAFRFSLETALKLRRHAEEEARKDLAQRIAGLERKEAQMLDLRGQLTGFVDARTEALLHGTFVPQLQMVDMGWMSVLKQKMATCHAEIKDAQDAVDASRKRLNQARVGVKVLETLRERRHAQWRTAENRRAENILSDLAGANWLRQAREETGRRPSG